MMQPTGADANVTAPWRWSPTAGTPEALAHRTRWNHSSDKPAETRDSTPATATASAVNSVSRVLSTTRDCKER